MSVRGDRNAHVPRYHSRTATLVEGMPCGARSYSTAPTTNVTFPEGYQPQAQTTGPELRRLKVHIQTRQAVEKRKESVRV